MPFRGVPQLSQSTPKIFDFGHPEDLAYLEYSKKARQIGVLKVLFMVLYVTFFGLFGQKVSLESKKMSFFVL
jgi:hypothetical protein